MTTTTPAFHVEFETVTGERASMLIGRGPARIDTLAASIALQPHDNVVRVAIVHEVAGPHMLFGRHDAQPGELVRLPAAHRWNAP